MRNLSEIIKVRDFGLALALTAAGIGFVEFLRYQTGSPLTVIIFAVPLIYLAYVGGFLAGVVAAAVFGVYVHLTALDSTGALIANAVSLAVVVLISWLIYDAKIQALNGSFQKMLDALSAVRRLKRDWSRMDEEERFQELFLIEDRLGNSAANIIGWRELRNQNVQDKQAVIGQTGK